MSLQLVQSKKGTEGQAIPPPMGKRPNVQTIPRENMIGASGKLLATPPKPIVPKIAGQEQVAGSPSPLRTGNAKEIREAMSRAKLAEKQQASAAIEAAKAEAANETAATILAWNKVLSQQRIAAMSITLVPAGDDSKSETYFNLLDPLTNKAPTFVTIPLKLSGCHFEGLGKIPKLSDDKTPLAARFGCFCSFDLPESFIEKNPALVERIPEFREAFRAQFTHIITSMFNQNVKSKIRTEMIKNARSDFMSKLTDAGKSKYKDALQKNPLSIQPLKAMAISLYAAKAHTPDNAYKKKKADGKGDTENGDDMSFEFETPDGEKDKPMPGFYIHMPVFRLTKGQNKTAVRSAYLKNISHLGEAATDKDKMKAMLETGVVYNEIAIYAAGSKTPINVVEERKIREEIVKEKIALMQSGQVPDDKVMMEKYNVRIAEVRDPFRRRIENGSVCVLKVTPDAYAQAGDSGHFGVRYSIVPTITMLKKGDGSFNSPIEMTESYEDCDTEDTLMQSAEKAISHSDLSSIEQKSLMEIESKKLEAFVSPTKGAIKSSQAIANKEDSIHMEFGEIQEEGYLYEDGNEGELVLEETKDNTETGKQENGTAKSHQTPSDEETQAYEDNPVSEQPIPQKKTKQGQSQPVKQQLKRKPHETEDNDTEEEISNKKAKQTTQKKPVVSLKEQSQVQNQEDEWMNELPELEDNSQSQKKRFKKGNEKKIVPQDDEEEEDE